MNDDDENTYPCRCSCSCSCGCRRHCRWLLDINEAPVVTAPTVSVEENQPIGTILIPNVQSVDQDINDFPTFQLVQATGVPDDGSEMSSAFRVDNFTGSVTLMKSILDFEYQRQYLLVFTVVDQGVVRCTPVTMPFETLGWMSCTWRYNLTTMCPE